MSELVALREPERLGAVIRGTDVRLVLSGHTHRVSALIGRGGRQPPPETTQ